MSAKSVFLRCSLARAGRSCHRLAAIVVLLFAVAPAWPTAGAIPPASAPEPIRLTLHAVPTTQPALAHVLLPEVLDQKPGNAAMLYMIAGRMEPSGKTHEDMAKIWSGAVDPLDAPLDHFPRGQVEQLLGGYTQALRYADLAAHREEAHWDEALRDLGFNALLPFLNDMRLLANVTAVQARYQLSQDDFAAAERTLQDGFALSRQLSDRPVLIHDLVAAGVTDLMLERGVLAWIARRNSPNLYWALSSLPDPYIPLRPVAEWERPSLYFTLPELRQALHGELGPDRWARVMQQAIKFADLSARPEGKRQNATEEPAVRWARLRDAHLSAARQYLVTTGVSADRANAMPPDQAAGMYLFHQYRSAADELWKAWALPFWEGGGQLRAAEQAVAQQQKEPEPNPLLGTTPQIWRARYQLARIDREIALMRIIEALRDYAARHDGKPPQTLEQITDLPVPLDPFTNKPFAYRLAGLTAILDAPSPEGASAFGGWKYELTFQR